MRRVNGLELADELDKLIDHRIMDPVLILGESGVGKSSIVSQVVQRKGWKVWDVRWAQLAPVDARGVPVADHTSKTTKFYSPDFWPQAGPGAIHLDEFNMASAGMMGLGQQLLLDRKFGDYVVPEDVFVWASGNRKQDFAAVNEVPAPVNNRLAHYELVRDFDSWRIWAYGAGIDSAIIGFLSNRSELLHKFDPEQRAWPSPRSWEMADRRLRAGISVEPVIGEAVAAEFDAHLLLIKHLPNLELIAKGQGQRLKFPDEPSLKFVATAELTRYALGDWETFLNVFHWFVDKCREEPEWASIFVLDLLRIQGRNDKKKNREYLTKLAALPEARDFVSRHTQLAVTA